MHNLTGKMALAETASALSGLGFGIRDRETPSIVGLCVMTDPHFQS